MINRGMVKKKEKEKKSISTQVWGDKSSFYGQLQKYVKELKKKTESQR